MTMITRLFCTTALSAFTFAGAASAEVTADDVWQNTRDVLATFGGDFSATKARRGDTLAITDMRMAFQFPFDAGNMTATFPDFQLIENGDGTVSLSYPETSAYKIAVEFTDKGTLSGSINVTVDNMSYIASGTPGVVTYVYSADNVTYNSSDISIKGGQSVDIAISGSVSDVSTTTRIAVASLVSINTDYSAASQELSVQISNPEEETIDTQNSFTGLFGATTIILPRGGLDIMNLAAAFRAGLNVTAATTTETYESRRVVMSNGEMVSDQITTAKNYVADIEINTTHVKSKGSASDTSMTFVAEQLIPFPFTISAKSIGSAFQFPLFAASELQDFELSLFISDLTIPDSIVAMIDPMHAMPNDPAAFSIDVVGKVNNMIDWLDFETVKAVIESDETPIEIHAVNLAALALDMFGSQLSGSGAATFDNTGGSPKPTGTLDLSLIGGNTLLDTLVSIGLVDEDQAMGARLAIATVTRPDPDAGEDALKSELEINEQGHITANGMRIK